MKNFFRPVVVFFGAAIIFGWLMAAPTFADPDAFYHLKITQLFLERGLIFEFPWLKFTTLAATFTDHHLLFHLLSAPFIRFGGVWGAKVFAVSLAAGFMAVNIQLWQKLGVRYAWVYSLALLTNAPLMLRLSLVKAVPLALIIFLFGLQALLAGKARRLFLISMVFVWAYGGWPILLIATTVMVFTRADYRAWLNWRRTFWRESYLIVAAFGGSLAGLIVNPYFPGNLYFSWQQVVQIGLINLQSQIQVGAEWYPFEIFYFLGNNSLALILLVIALVMGILRYRQLNRDHLGLAILTVSLLFMTLKSRRYVEYFAPLAVWLVALTFVQIIRRDDLIKAGQIFRSWWRRLPWRAALLTVYLCGALIFIVSRDLWSVKQHLSVGYSYDHLSGVSGWLQAKTPIHSLVAHSNWDDWPILFYHNHWNTYVFGLDPTFMYNYDHVLYRDYEKFFQGTAEFDAYDFVTKRLGAVAVLLRSTAEYQVIKTQLLSDRRFELGYEDDEAMVFLPVSF